MVGNFFRSGCMALDIFPKMWYIYRVPPQWARVSEARRNPDGPKVLFFPVLRQVLLTGGLSSTKMTLILVLFQNLGHLLAEGSVDVAESFGHILMYRTLADPVSSGGLTDGGAIFHDVGAEDHATLLVRRYVHHTILPPYKQQTTND